MTRIMVVDDEAVITTQLEERLTMMGYEVIGIAASGDEAIEKARQLRPDIILMDIVMPGVLNGIAASKVIKKELDIPVIFLTAYADDKLVGDAKNVEPLGYLIKPFQERQIRAAIEIAVYKREIELRLKESEERYRSVVDTATDAIIIIDNAGIIQSWNTAAEIIFGYSAEEVKDKKFTIILDAETGNELQQKLDKMVSTGISTIVGTRMEYAGIRKDQSSFKMEFSLTSWDTKRGFFFTIIARDISEREEVDKTLKLALKERDILFQEMNHRIKSMMQIINNIIMLQTDYMQDAKSMEKLNNCLNRIKAMELLHSNAFQTEDLNKIKFNDYLSSLIANLVQTYKSNSAQIDLKINNTVPLLSIDVSIPCSLIINELVVNSLKYAFQDKQHGEIHISLKSEKHIYMLTVSDNGNGLPADFNFDSTKSFGLRLVKTLVNQLGGKIELIKENGTTYNIVLKDI